MQQAKDADPILWKKLAENTRGNVSQRPDGTKPIEAALTVMAIDPEVHFLMMPIQKSSRVVQVPMIKTPKIKRERGKERKARRAKDQLAHQRDVIRRPHKINPYVLVIIVDFASSLPMGKRCKRGFHVCWKCFEPQPYTSCQH